MAASRMDITSFVGKLLEEDDVDLLREGVRVLTQAVMETEVSTQIGATPYERSGARTAYRNGYRSRTWDTRVGTIELKIPKVSAGTYFPSLLEPRRRAEKALHAVIVEAYVKGVSTRKLDDLVRALGIDGISRSEVSRSHAYPRRSPHPGATGVHAARRRFRPACVRCFLRHTIRRMSPPETRYAWNDGTALAYQVVSTSSSGPDLLLAPGSVTHLEVLWQEPRVERFLTRLAGFSRLILMDPRGLGLSDRLTDVPALDERVDDLLAVLDAAGSERAAFFGNADTGPPVIATAVRHPERVSHLILCGTWARSTKSDDYPFGWTDEDWEAFERYVRDDWGKVGSSFEDAPARSEDEAFRSWYATLMRQGASPRAVLLLGEMSRTVDVRSLLPRVGVPTLVMHRVGDPVVEVENGRYLAERIPGARWVELAGEDFLLWSGDLDTIGDEMEEFLTGHRIGPEPTRIVATVMFTDVVGSTERAGALGDTAWSDLLRAHDARLRAELRRFGGREIDTAGDGFLASFDSPTAAIRCAQAVQATVREIGVEVRIGLHTGECQVSGEKLRGVAVHIGARVAAKAQAGEVLASQTVKDLVAGSGFAFEDAGEHELKGIPDRWRLYRAVDG